MNTNFNERENNILKILENVSSKSSDKIVQAFFNNILGRNINDTVRKKENLYNNESGTYDILTTSILRGKNNDDATIIKNLIETYIKKYPSPLLYKTKLSDSLSVFYQDTCDYLKVPCDNIEPAITKPIDLAIIHELHEYKEVTKQDLVSKLKTTTDTIEAHIKSINSSFGEIIKTRMLGRNCLYSMPDTIHPLRFNFTMEQIGDLIRALALSYRHIPEPDEHSNSISEDMIKSLCAEIWLQLSDYAKERTRDIYFNFDVSLEDFISDVENYIKNPQEESKERDFDKLLVIAFKSEAVCNIRTRTEKFINYYVFPNTFGTSTSASNTFSIEPKEAHIHQSNGCRSHKPNSTQVRSITVDEIIDVTIIKN